MCVDILKVDVHNLVITTPSFLTSQLHLAGHLPPTDILHQHGRPLLTPPEPSGDVVQQGGHRPVNMAATLLPSLMNGRHMKEKGKEVAQPNTAGELHRGTELVVSFSKLAVCNVCAVAPLQ